MPDFFCTSSFGLRVAVVELGGTGGLKLSSWQTFSNQFAETILLVKGCPQLGLTCAFALGRLKPVALAAATCLPGFTASVGA